MPSAPWMKRAKGPSSLHSPFSAPGLDSLSGTVVLLAVMAIDGRMEARELATRDNGVVGKAGMVPIALGIVCSACVTSSCNDIKDNERLVESEQKW